MAIPEQITPTKLADYLEIMTRAIFQAGLRWSMIEAKWPAFMRAFDEFDPHVVANYDAKDVAHLSANESIIRSPKKIEATVANARTLLALDAEFNGFPNYLHSFETYEELEKDIKKRFKFMGELNVYYFLFRLKEPVPPFEEWITTIEGEHPRMREMVEHAAKNAAH
jgi:3-methyladenine DNA glycosylase Tag